VLIPTKAIYNIHLELGKHLHIYVACSALSLVNLCRIPYESLVMLSKSRSRTHSSSYMHYSYTRSKRQQLTYRITLVFNVLSFCLTSLIIYCIERIHVAMQKYKRRKGSKRWTSVPIIKTMGTRCPPPCEKKRENNKDSPCLS